MTQGYSQADGLPEHAVADPELQPAWRSHLGHDAEFILDAQGEPGHVEVAMAAVDVDQQVQVAAGVASPRATEPKTRMLRTQNRWPARRIASR